MNDDTAIIDAAIRLHDQALDALECGDPQGAAAAALEALELFERESGLEHPDVANVLNCLARIHECAGEFAAAEACSRRAVGIMRHVRELGSSEDIERLYIQSLGGLGNVLRTLGSYAEAEQVLREAIACAENALGGDDEDLVVALNHLAVLFKYTGKFGEAAALYERALQITERLPGHDFLLATLLHNVGGLAHARGSYANGEPAARRSVECRERALGPDHPAVAADLAALAALIDGQERHTEAGEMYERALAIFERVYGPDHYEMAVTLNNLAGVRLAEGNVGEAEAIYRRSLAIKERLFGPDHPDVAMTLNNLALLLSTAGRCDEAALLYERALDTFSSRLDADHPKIAAVVENYSSLLREQKRGGAARALEARFPVAAKSGITSVASAHAT